MPILLLFVLYYCRNKPNIDATLASAHFDETDAPSDAVKEGLKLKQQWEDVARVVKDRSDALDEVLPLATEFEQSKKNIGEWMRSVRPKVEDLEVVSVDKRKLNNQGKVVQVNYLRNRFDFFVCLLR